MNSREDFARSIALAHSQIEPSVEKVIRLVSDREDQPDEPIKLLESNTETASVGIVPIFFGPSADVPYPSVIVEVTPKEFEQVESHIVGLPDGWRLADVLFDRQHQS